MVNLLQKKAIQPHKRTRRDPCPGTLPPQGVSLFTEPHSELNAGLVVVCTSRHQPILDLAKLDIPVIKDTEAWGRLQTHGTSALRGYRHLMKDYLSTCLDPEGMSCEVHPRPPFLVVSFRMPGCTSYSTLDGLSEWTLRWL